MNLIFVSSSDFCLPILESILAAERDSLTLWQVFERQYLDLMDNVNAKEFETKAINPGWWLEPGFLDKVRQQLKSKSNSIDSKVHLATVITQPNTWNHSKELYNPVAKFCLENNIPIFQPTKLNQEISQLKEHIPNCDLGFLASFGQILNQEVLDYPKFGFVNWHPSKLPCYRGATPMQTAIRRGDQNTALSWLEMTKAMDAGNIWLQIEVNILATDTITNLSTKMGQLGAQTWAFGALGKLLS